MSNANLSPDTQDILNAISKLNGGASIVPEDVGAAVNYALSNLGPEVIRSCIGKSDDFKRGFLIAAAMFKLDD